MANEIVEGGEKFGLLSECLAELSVVLDSEWADERPVFRSWLAGHDLSIFETEVFDEREALKIANALARGLNMFSFLPGSVLKFQNYYERATQGREEYLKYALVQQQQRLSRLDGSTPQSAEIEKDLRGIQRAVDKVLDEIDYYADDNELFEILDARIKRGRLGRIFADALASGGGNYFIDTNLEYVYEAADAISREINAKVVKALYRFLELMVNRERLEDSLLIRREIDKLIGPTLAELRKLGAVETPSRPEVRPLLLRGEPVFPQPGERKRKKDGRDSSEGADRNGSDEKGFDSMEVTNRKLLEAIRVAESFGKLRVLLPAESRLQARFRPQWEKVLARLGHRGGIEFVTYEDLKKSTDKSTPVLTFKGLNTHKYLWGRNSLENLFVIDITPMLFLNSLGS